MIVIPAMDLLGGRVVRLRQGDYAQATVYPVEPEAVLDGYASAGATRAHVVDLDGAREGRAAQAELIARLVDRFKGALELQVGGGVRSLDQVSAWRDAGASRVVVGTRAADDPDFVTYASAILPLIVAVDARDGRVSTRGWTHTTELLATDLALACAARGASGFLYTDISRDGTGDGPNVDATESLARAVAPAEVIASGGVGSLDHLRALASRRVIGAAVVGRALFEGAFTVGEALAAVREP